MSENTPLMPRPASAPQPDSHLLTLLRLLVTGYLIAVAGVSLKYKLETKDKHTNWRIPFQFSTVSFLTLLAYNLQAALWTLMHLLLPEAPQQDPSQCEGHVMRAKITKALSPPARASCPKRRFFYSLFYTVAHVFTFTNTILYWAVLVPSGHGGFKAPKLPHIHNPGTNSTFFLYNPNKGLFEEDDIKAFSIINVWTITSIIGFLEVLLFNSIRRQTPVASHSVGVVLATAAYLAWAGLGKLLTGHAGLFFLDTKMIGSTKASVAATLGFLALTPGIFTYLYGLIAMRESMTARQAAQ
ncbi:hypothetical protein TruAng_006293 [Truncatella angustata]|nr:hypothetical protein TruAng_006293 [Truncatella angustata]